MTITTIQSTPQIQNQGPLAGPVKKETAVVSEKSSQPAPKMAADQLTFTTRKTYKANILQLTTATIGGSLVGGAVGHGFGSLLGAGTIKNGEMLIKTGAKFGRNTGLGIGAIVGASIGSINTIQSPAEGALKGLGMGFMAAGVYGFVTHGGVGGAIVTGMVGAVSGAAAGYLSSKVQR